MTSREFTESLVFEQLEPDPAAETVRLLGILVTLMHNVNMRLFQRSRPFTYDDFVPNPYAPSRMEREQSFAAVMAGYAANSKHNRKPD
jgi:hypothetical protein